MRDFLGEIVIKHFYFLLLLLSSLNTFAASTIAHLKGPLNVYQIQKCEKSYKKICSYPYNRNISERITYQWPCMNEKMKYDKSCQQSYLIRETTGYPPEEIRRYAKGIVVFKIVTLADAQTIFYMVDKQGSLIELTQDENLITKNESYIKLKKNYPNIAFTSFIFWSKLFQDQFPKTYLTSHKMLELIFKQELRDGPCVACKTIGIATVAYIFDHQGIFLGVKLLNIESLDDTIS